MNRLALSLSLRANISATPKAMLTNDITTAMMIKRARQVSVDRSIAFSVPKYGGYT